MRMIGDPELRIINVDWRTTREDRVAEVFQEFESAAVTSRDFERALDELRSRPTWTRSPLRIGFHRESA